MFMERGGYYFDRGRNCEADVISHQYLFRPRPGRTKSPRQDGHDGEIPPRKSRMSCTGFLGCMAQSRGEELLQTIPHLDLVAGTQKYHRVVEYVEQVILKRRLEAKQMDDERYSIVDVAEEEGSAEYDPRSGTQAPNQGSCVC